MMESNLQVLYPNKIGDGGNNDSLVLYGKLLGTSFLFTGDLEKEGEEEPMTSYPNLKGKGSSKQDITVLKTLHQKLLDQLKSHHLLLSQQVKIIDYKHPNDETLERFKERHIEVLRQTRMVPIPF